jgi:hypothetical protein
MQKRELPPLGPPSPAAVKAANDLCFAAIEEYMRLADSYAQSAAAAAWRGDRKILETHLSQIRLVLVETIKTFKEIK